MLNQFHVRLRRRQRWKTKKLLLFPVVTDDKAVEITSKCVTVKITSRYVGDSSVKYELNCQWDRANIEDRLSVCITLEYLPKLE